MSKYSTWWYGKWSGFTSWFSELKWTGLLSKFRGGKPGFNLTLEDWKLLQESLASDYYLILTRRKTHLTTYSIAFMTWIKQGKWPDYSHALMNLDLEDDAADFMKFKLMEATSTGVHYSRFDEIFDCDYVCLLEPVNMDHDEWKSVMKGLAEQLGKPYDNLFDVYDDTHVSCVEMCLDALRANPNYQRDFPTLEAMIQQAKNLTPQMYRECADFRVVLEIKR